MKIVEYLKNNYWLLIILLIGGFLRFYKLDFQSVWLDELHTLLEANPSQSFEGVYNSLMISEQSPPLYFYVIYFIFKIFGYSVVVLRCFSAVVGVLGIFSIYLLGKELYSKNTGLIAAAILCVNSFHIYYSQDGRIYTLLFFGTTISFFYLIRFIKIPNHKNAIYYGISAALMLYGHFFGLFALLSQYILLLLTFIALQKSQRKNFFLLALVSGIVTLLLFAPSIPLLFETTKMKSFWIPMPEVDAYTIIYKEFFGNSEMLEAVINFAILLFFIKFVMTKNVVLKHDSIINDKDLFAGIVLSIWIVIVLTVTLVRSYLSLPLIVSRYFINILPAVILLAAISIGNIKNRIVSTSFLSVVILFSIVQLIVVKKYYSSITKTQFREISQYVINNTTEKEAIVSSLDWYFSYFFSKDDANRKVVGMDLDSYVEEMTKDSTKQQSFWYMDAHLRPFSISNQNKAFLDEKFFNAKGVNLHDAWAKLYIPRAAMRLEVDIKKYKPLKVQNGHKIECNLERFEYDNGNLTANGWAFLENMDINNSELSLILISDISAIKLPTEMQMRPDVSLFFEQQVSKAGFSSNTSVSNIPAGNYKLGIIINNKTTEGIFVTDKMIVIK